MHTLKKEYDCFGPWLLEINSQDEVPPLFRDDFKFGDEVKFAFKIPVHIERRNASPGSILYDSVVSLYENQIYVFNHIGKTVTTRVIDFQEILMIQNIKNILKGELKIYIPGDKVVIEYNTVSNTIINHVIDLIRQKYTHSNEIIYKLPHLDEVPVMVEMFNSLWKEIKRKEPVELLNYQSGIAISPYRKSGLHKAFPRRYKMELQDCIFLNNEKELIIISRVNNTKYSRLADYSDMHTYIPFQYIEDINIEKNKEFLNLRNVTIHTDKHSVIFMIDEKLQIEEWVNKLAKK